MKKIISLFLSIVMLLSITAELDFSAYALSSSGYCGADVYYTFDSSTGELIISGTGPMTEFQYSKSPFYSRYGDFGIETVTVTSGVTSIGSYSFYDCRGITSVTLPKSIKSIGDDAFYNCNGLTSIVFPNNLTTIGNDSFEFCKSLSSVKIPDSVKSIGSKAFYSCTGLTNIKIGESVTHIGSYAFNICIGLTSVTIPDSVTNIDDCAFMSCTGLTSVRIGKNVKRIGECAFNNCTSLNDIYYSGSKSSWDKISIGAYNDFYRVVIHYNTGNKTNSFTKSKPVLKAKTAKKSINLSWKKVSGASGYQIQYSQKKNMKGAKKKTVNGSKKTKATIKKLKSKKTYYVRIRAYKKVNGKTQYSKWSSKKTVKTK